MRVISELPLEGERPVLVVSREDMENLLDLSPAGLTELAKKGLVVRRGHGSYLLEESVRNYVQHLRSAAARWDREGQSGLTLSGERARLQRAKAEQVELANAKTKGELVRVEDVRREWLTLATDLRSALLAIPARLAARLGMDRGQAALLESEMREALGSLTDE